MAFVSPIPSQKEGTDYLNVVANKVSGKLRTGGHSKGGNIAVYSAIHCDPYIEPYKLRYDLLFVGSFPEKAPPP